ncbi:hypothetical protein GQ42DRAFT_163630 [Ramicandelaber brevisporus]|nr:hypothetical protein GQ42DRAFT_163630 [Ramicandelaber brevisporus]
MSSQETDSLLAQQDTTADTTPAPAEVAEAAAAPAPAPAAQSDDQPALVNTANLTDLKLACDDALRAYLTSDEVGYKEYHTHTDVKLVLGYLSVVVAGIDAYMTWTSPVNPATLWITKTCLFLYIALNSIYVLYTTFVQKNTVFVGVKKGLSAASANSNSGNDGQTNGQADAANAAGHILSVSSSVKGYDHHYKLTFSVRPNVRSKYAPLRVPSVQLVKSFGEWFTEAGEMDVEGFHGDIKTLIGQSLEGKQE